MNSMSKVIKFKWTKHNKDDAPIYRLYIERKILLGAQRQRLIEEKRLRKRQTESRQRFISGLEAAARMPEGNLEKLKMQSPYIYKVAKMVWADSLPPLFAEVTAVAQNS